MMRRSRSAARVNPDLPTAWARALPLVMALGVLVMLAGGTSSLARAPMDITASENGALLPTSLLTSEPPTLRHSQPYPGCQPRYHDPEWIMTVRDDEMYEPLLRTGDFNGDGLDDVMILRSRWQTHSTWMVDVLLNDAQRGLTLASPSIFVGPVPQVQDPRDVVLADFNRDGRPDIFVADEGYDAPPHPGYQNTLMLSVPGGKLVDSSDLLPLLSDMTHSAAAADVDADGDLDLFVGNIWGQEGIDPQLLLNRGGGSFSVATHRLPASLQLTQNGYTTCEFADVNGDGAPDLILGDAGDDIENPLSTPDSVVLLNDGHGVFQVLPGAMPSKLVSRYDIAHDIVPLQLDGDDHIDLVMVYEGWSGPGHGWQGSYLQALVNNGDGTFRDETSSRLETLDRRVWIPRLELRDMNRDGRLDMVAFPWDDRNPDPILLLGDGAGHFHRSELAIGLGYLYYAFLDLERDGGNDIVMATFAPREDIYVFGDRDCLLFLPRVGQRADDATP